MTQATQTFNSLGALSALKGQAPRQESEVKETQIEETQPNKEVCNMEENIQTNKEVEVVEMNHSDIPERIDVKHDTDKTEKTFKEQIEEMGLVKPSSVTHNYSTTLGYCVSAINNLIKHKIFNEALTDGSKTPEVWDQIKQSLLPKFIIHDIPKSNTQYPIVFDLNDIEVSFEGEKLDLHTHYDDQNSDSVFYRLTKLFTADEGIKESDGLSMDIYIKPRKLKTLTKPNTHNTSKKNKRQKVDMAKNTASTTVTFDGNIKELIVVVGEGTHVEVRRKVQ